MLTVTPLFTPYVHMLVNCFAIQTALKKSYVLTFEKQLHTLDEMNTSKS